MNLETTGPEPMPKGQVHVVIRRNLRQVDSQIKAGSAIEHHGEDRACRADQVDVGSPDMRCNKQAAGGPGKRQSRSFKDVRRFANDGAGIPRFSAPDHLNWISSQPDGMLTRIKQLGAAFVAACPEKPGPGVGGEPLARMSVAPRAASGLLKMR